MTIKLCTLCGNQYNNPSNRFYCDNCKMNRNCQFDGCDRPVRTAYGRPVGLLCPGHDARRFTKTLETKSDSPIRKMNKKGEGSLNKQGYKLIWIEGKQILEHRYVMENTLSRPLESWEEVHHINGVRNDNRIENLELWVISQPPGQRVEDLVEWAKEIIRRYEPVNHELEESW